MRPEGSSKGEGHATEGDGLLGVGLAAPDAPPPPRRGCRPHTMRLADSRWPRGVLSALRPLGRPLGCASGAVASSLLLLAWWARELAGELDDLSLREDPLVARLSEHCGARGREELEQEREGEEQGLRLHSVLVIAGHGDSSPEAAWPGEAGAGASWDCTPEVLPRYWRLNGLVRFRVATAEGRALERSFTPELGPQGYACGPGQLTGRGFVQMARLGRDLSAAYDGHIGRAAAAGWRLLRVRSLDSRRSLASAVGLLMSLLGTPEALAALGEGSELRLAVEPNASADVLAAPEGAPLGGLRPGDHLLARWCRSLPLPCAAGGRCTTLEEAGGLLERGEEGFCRWLASPPGAAWRRRLLADCTRSSSAAAAPSRCGAPTARCWPPRGRRCSGRAPAAAPSWRPGRPSLRTWRGPWRATASRPPAPRRTSAARWRARSRGSPRPTSARSAASSSSSTPFAPASRREQPTHPRGTGRRWPRPRAPRRRRRPGTTRPCRLRARSKPWCRSQEESPCWRRVQPARSRRGSGGTTAARAARGAASARSRRCRGSRRRAQP
ncbi:unnamed protein product, partial [Prorocentrum cordatum]